MKTKSIAFALAVGSVTVVGVAGAQEKDQNIATPRAETLGPVSNALELTVATGYAQGFGDIAANRLTLTDVAQPGGAVQVGVGYRVIPRLTLGLYGSGAMFSRGDQVDASSNLYAASAGVQADWHFIPSGSEFDPWVSLGTGWRGYWVRADQGTTSLQGLELAKLQLGVDYRVSPAIAVSPVIGADLSTFLSESNPGTSSYSNIADPRVNTFVFAGLQGRFDIPLGSQSSSTVAAR